MELGRGKAQNEEDRLPMSVGISECLHDFERMNAAWTRRHAGTACRLEWLGTIGFEMIVRPQGPSVAPQGQILASRTAE